VLADNLDAAAGEACKQRSCSWTWISRRSSVEDGGP
jgi:hypothetical protein